MTKLSDEEQQLVKQQAAAYKETRHVVQYGDLYRLLSPFEGNETAWMFVSEDKREAFVAYFRVLAEPNAPFASIRLKGLDPNLTYTLSDSGKGFGGDELMYSGLTVPAELQGDYQSATWYLSAKE